MKHFFITIVTNISHLCRFYFGIIVEAIFLDKSLNLQKVKKGNICCFHNYLPFELSALNDKGKIIDVKK